jgi:hypothetical protein
MRSRLHAPQDESVAVVDGSLYGEHLLELQANATGQSLFNGTSG